MKPASIRLQIITPGYRWHTQMFDNMLKGISAEEALKRIENRTNHIAWTCGNLVNCRYWLANVLGIEDKDPHEEIFKDAKALDPQLQYPLLEDLQKEWHRISPKVFERLLTISDDELDAAYPSGMDIDFLEENKLNMIGMAMDRVSYLLGQLGLLRRAIINKSTDYSVNADLRY